MDSNSAEAKHLLAFIERIERLEEDKKQVSEDIKDVYAEAKGTGYDVKTIRKIVSLRKQDRDKRREEEEMLSLYMSALGMLADTPLGEAAIARVSGRPINPTTALREQQEAEERRRQEELAANVARRKAEAEAEAAKAEVRRQKAQAALRTGYIEDARKAGFDAYDVDVEWTEPDVYKGDDEALRAHREGWDGCAKEAAKFGVKRRKGKDQPSTGATP